MIDVCFLRCTQRQLVFFSIGRLPSKLLQSSLIKLLFTLQYDNNIVTSIVDVYRDGLRHFLFVRVCLIRNRVLVIYKMENETNTMEILAHENKTLPTTASITTTNRHNISLLTNEHYVFIYK